ncbi:MAG: 3-keto-disaccharide hydrolase, partial [Planctomycetia bacterium]
DLTGWKPFLGDKDGKPEAVWMVEDGVLICKGSPVGYIRTEKDYENYHLTLDWRWAPGSKGGNSGVLLHTVGEDMIWPKSLEAQLYRENAGDIWVIGGTEIMVPNIDTRRKGRQIVNLSDGDEKPLGEWNTYDITCKGDAIELKVNGKVVNAGDKASLTKGAICLQAEGAEIHFRNIVLKPLD